MAAVLAVILLTRNRGDVAPSQVVEVETVARPSSPERPAAVEIPTSSSSSPTPVIGGEPVPDLVSRRLEIPVKDIARSDLRASFDEARGGRQHEAIDILAPRNTPVIAVEDGSVEKLFTSKAGGLTIYQFDPTSTYVYYYAHLERYADGIREGGRVKRGEVIGYVGTSGNAPKDTPHLHFAIFKLTEARQWWKGAPIDPFEVLK